mmetsp:Transcript_51921/g.110331  ORF Transcript_51921/g.110331 Transcript_51921/m.110331 type:complete len:495 (-) Transcript_51921:584-2068(-)
MKFAPLPQHSKVNSNSNSNSNNMAPRSEDLYSQLLAFSQQVEAQLRALRGEHEALCRCLDRTGVVAMKDVQAEAATLSKVAQDRPRLQPPPRTMSPPRSGPPSSHLGGVVGVGGGAGGASKVSVASATTAASRGRGGFGSTTAGHLGSAGPPGRAATSSPRPVSRLVGGREASPSVVEKPQVPRTLAKHGSPGVPPPQSNTRPDTARSQVAEVPAEEPDRGADLYEVVQRLLNPNAPQADQAKAMRQFNLLMKNPRELPNTWNGPGTPLSSVVRAGRADLARALLRAKANPNTRDTKGVCALHLAVFDGNLDLCRVLLAAKGEVDVCDRHGQTPLFFAPTKDICKLLVERRSDVTILNRKGQSALHLAGRAGLHEVLDWFSTRVSKQLVDLRDVHGATAKFYIQQSGVPRPENLASPRPASPTTRTRLVGRGEQEPMSAGNSRTTTDSLPIDSHDSHNNAPRSHAHASTNSAAPPPHHSNTNSNSNISSSRPIS